MERDVVHKQLYDNCPVDCFNVLFSTYPGHLRLIYANLHPTPKWKHKGLWCPLCLVCTLPENPSLLESLSSTSRGRLHTRRDGNGRSPLVQPGETLMKTLRTDVDLHQVIFNFTTIKQMIPPSQYCNRSFTM